MGRTLGTWESRRVSCFVHVGDDADWLAFNVLTQFLDRLGFPRSVCGFCFINFVFYSIRSMFLSKHTHTVYKKLWFKDLNLLTQWFLSLAHLSQVQGVMSSSDEQKISEKLPFAELAAPENTLCQERGYNTPMIYFTFWMCCCLNTLDVSSNCSNLIRQAWFVPKQWSMCRLDTLSLHVVNPNWCIITIVRYAFGSFLVK